jgi:hypothetical protein
MSYHPKLLAETLVNLEFRVQHLPFKWPGQKKGVFGFKLFVFLASGFSIPFAAAAYQLCVSRIMLTIDYRYFVVGKRPEGRERTRIWRFMDAIYTFRRLYKICDQITELRIDDCSIASPSYHILRLVLC